MRQCSLAPPLPRRREGCGRCRALTLTLNLTLTPTLTFHPNPDPDPNPNQVAAALREHLAHRYLPAWPRTLEARGAL